MHALHLVRSFPLDHWRGGQKKPKVNERPDFFPSCPHRSHGSVCRHLEQAEEERGRKTAELIDTLPLFFFFSVSVCEFSAHLSLPDHKTVCGKGRGFDFVMNCRGYYERGLAWSILLWLKEFFWQLSISLWVHHLAIFVLFYAAVCKCRGFPARLWDGVQLRMEIGVAGRQRKRAPSHPGSPHMQEQRMGNCGTTTAADRKQVLKQGILEHTE